MSITMECSERFESATYIAIHVVQKEHSSRFWKNSEANTSEFLKNLDGIVTVFTCMQRVEHLF